MQSTESLTLRLRRWKTDRGALAQLRGALRPQLRSRAWPLMAQLCDLNGWQAPIYETVVGLWAADPDSHSERAGNFGASCRRLRIDHESFDVRFRQLIDCNTREELCEKIVGIALAMLAKGIGINYDTLFDDLKFYGNGGVDRVRTNWAQAYWGERSEIE